MNKSGLLRQMKNGAFNFYWIAGLSIINSLFFFFGKRPGFVIGLGITMSVDIFAHNIAQSFPNSVLLIKSIGLLLDLLICGMFTICGLLAWKRFRWAFIIGMVLFGLDAVLTLVSGDVIGFGFHLFFLWFLYVGLRSLDELNMLDSENERHPIFPNIPKL